MIWFIIAFVIAVAIMVWVSGGNKYFNKLFVIVNILFITFVLGTVIDTIYGGIISSKAITEYEAPESLYKKVKSQEIQALKDNYELHGKFRANEDLYYVFLVDGKVQKREASSIEIKETDKKKSYLCTYKVNTTINLKVSRFLWLLQREIPYKSKKQVLEVSKGTIEKITKIDLE